MIRARVITTWRGSGTAPDPYRPALPEDVPGLTWRDATAQETAAGLPAPAALIVEVETMDLAGIEAHRDYGPVAILWRHDRPDAALEVADRAALDGVLKSVGVSDADLTAARGAARTAAEAEANVRVWLKSRERR